MASLTAPGFHMDNGSVMVNSAISRSHAPLTDRMQRSRAAMDVVPPAGSGRWWGALLAHEHALGLALEGDVGLAADIDRDPFDVAADEAVGALPRVVQGHRVADVSADGETFARDHVATWLGLDASLADLHLSVVE